MPRPEWGLRALLASLLILAPAGLAAPASAAAARVSAVTAASTVKVGSVVVVTGELSTHAVGKTVVLQRNNGKTWVTAARAKTVTGGRYTVSARAPRVAATWLLRATVTGSAQAVSTVLHLRVVKTAFTVEAEALSPVAAGEAVVVSGRVTPKATGSVGLQALNGSVWTTVATAKLSKASTFTLRSVRPTGRSVLRVTKAYTKAVAAGSSARLSVTVAAPPPSITTNALPPATAGLPYSTRMSVAGGVAPYTWSLAFGGLPPGLALSGDGQISGVPGATGSPTLTVTVTDAVGRQASRPLILSVVLSPVAGNTLSSWGHNSRGELGIGSTANTAIAVPVPGLTGVTAVAGGGNNGYARRFDGTVWAWGYNGFGEVGNGTTTDTALPVKVKGLTGVTAVAGGTYAGYALRSDGTVWAWGYNRHGELGNGATVDSSLPVQVSGLTSVVAVGAGQNSAYAVRSDGSAWAWGWNDFGQLGDGTTTTRTTPVRLTGLPAVVAVAGGGETAYALAANGTVWAWGYNNLGELGNGTTTASLSPLQVSGVTGATAIAASLETGYALAGDGTEWSWGDNGNGQLGDGTTTDRPLPVKVTGLSGVTAIAAGGSQAGYALRFDGTVSAWGYNGQGQLGDATTTNHYSATPVNGLTGVVAIGGGNASGFGLAVLSG
ncbi:MAG: hypothetical protein QOI76_4139 [Frankiales bacterium]|nr:hypothetical protein [Frankiales bacterium]